MAKKTKPFEGLEDPAGEEWQAAADGAWAAAEKKAERARAKAENEAEAPSAWSFYEAPALPDFAAAASSAVKIEVLGRFVIQDGAVHDVTRATGACRLVPLGPGASRTFVHFGHELEAAAGDAIPHAVCMG